MLRASCFMLYAFSIVIEYFCTVVLHFATEQSGPLGIFTVPVSRNDLCYLSRIKTS